MNALGFYDKMGFTQGLQYRYILKKEALADILRKKKDILASEQFHTIEMTGEPFQKYFEAVKNCTVNSSFEQINQYGRHMFHTFHEDAIWYCEALECYTMVRTITGFILWAGSLKRSKRINSASPRFHTRKRARHAGCSAAGVRQQKRSGAAMQPVRDVTME